MLDTQMPRNSQRDEGQQQTAEQDLINKLKLDLEQANKDKRVLAEVLKTASRQSVLCEETRYIYKALANKHLPPEDK